MVIGALRTINKIKGIELLWLLLRKIFQETFGSCILNSNQQGKSFPDRRDSKSKGFKRDRQKALVSRMCWEGETKMLEVEVQII